jgi:hypothetical protein
VRGPVKSLVRVHKIKLKKKRLKRMGYLFPKRTNETNPLCKKRKGGYSARDLKCVVRGSFLGDT